jgi:hypothetical protein
MQTKPAKALLAVIRFKILGGLYIAKVMLKLIYAQNS